MAFLLSPGVQVTEKDFTSVVPAVATAAGAYAGVFRWGPVMDPVFITSENELVKKYGAPNDATATSFFSAANFLSYSNNLLLVRVDTDSKNAVATETGGVTAIAPTAAGTLYTAFPDVVISAPNITGGVQAEADVTELEAVQVVLVNAGSGYAADDVISVPGVGAGTAATITVNTVLGSGEIDTFTLTTGGTYTSVTGTTAVAVTGGTGTLATFDVSLGVKTVAVTTGGTGYTSATVSFTGGTAGSAATADATVTVGGIKIKNFDEFTSLYADGAGVVGAFAAKYPGALGNALTVHMVDTAQFTGWTYEPQFDRAPGANEVHVVVVDTTGAITGAAGTILEKFEHLSKVSTGRRSDGTNVYYKDVLNTSSQWVYWMDHPTGTTGWGTSSASSLAAAVAESLSGGTDDLAATDGELQAGFALFANSEAYDIGLIIAGKATTTTATNIINNVAEVRKDCIVFVSPQNTTTGEPIIGTGQTPATAITTYRAGLPSSSYAVLDSGFKYQYDRYNDTFRWVPLNADIAGITARTELTNDAWFSPGGLNRGQVKNVVKLAYNPDQTARDTLYKAGVNPVVSFVGQGTVLYGDKTLFAAPSAFDRINVRRLFIVLEKAISQAAKFQLFEFNDQFTRAQFRAIVEPFLRDVQGRRGITDFKVVCDETNNPGDVVDANRFVADIFVKPARSINFISLNFVATRSGLSFEEAGA